jgi:hypothetical protein
MLCAKPKATSCVNTDAGVDLTRTGDQCRSNATGYAVLTRPKLAHELIGDLDKF